MSTANPTPFELLLLIFEPLFEELSNEYEDWRKNNANEPEDSPSARYPINQQQTPPPNPFVFFSKSLCRVSRIWCLVAQRVIFQRPFCHTQDQVVLLGRTLEEHPQLSAYMHGLGVIIDQWKGTLAAETTDSLVRIGKALNSIVAMDGAEGLSAPPPFTQLYSQGIPPSVLFPAGSTSLLSSLSSALPLRKLYVRSSDPSRPFLLSTLIDQLAHIPLKELTIGGAISMLFQDPSKTMEKGDSRLNHDPTFPLFMNLTRLTLLDSKIESKEMPNLFCHPMAQSKDEHSGEEWMPRFSSLTHLSLYKTSIFSVFPWTPYRDEEGYGVNPYIESVTESHTEIIVGAFKDTVKAFDIISPFLHSLKIVATQSLDVTIFKRFDTTLEQDESIPRKANAILLRKILSSCVSLVSLGLGTSLDSHFNLPMVAFASAKLKELRWFSRGDADYEDWGFWKTAFEGRWRDGGNWFELFHPVRDNEKTVVRDALRRSQSRSRSQQPESDLNIDEVFRLHEETVGMGNLGFPRLKRFELFLFEANFKDNRFDKLSNYCERRGITFAPCRNDANVMYKVESEAEKWDWD